MTSNPWDDELKRKYTLVVSSPAYDPLSGGVRALYLLAHHLQARGFRTLLASKLKEAQPPFEVPLMPAERHLVTYPHDICIYPEISRGNPRSARHVVRFLLNRPGLAQLDAVATYGPQDFFVHFDKNHVPAGRQSQDLYTPLVDRNCYHRNGEAKVRSGFVVFGWRDSSLSLNLPDWATPVEKVTRLNPKTHEQLGDIYRSARAFVALQRTTAIYEAIACGCPVVCQQSRGFSQATFQPRFEGAGMSWNFTEAGIEEASRTVDRFNEIYAGIEASYPARVEEVFLNILRVAAARDE